MEKGTLLLLLLLVS